MSGLLVHEEAARTIVFGDGALDRVEEHAGGGFTLLTTARAAKAAPSVVSFASAMLEVAPGLVQDVAAGLRDEVRGDRLVALGGGRVIDVAKALAACGPPRRVVAIPTSLSGAEMTGWHRHARGVSAATPHARASVVLNDPRWSASQPVALLAASTANALAHAVAAVVGARATPLSAAVGREAVRGISAGWEDPAPDRHALGLAALLAGWAVDRSGIGPHHVLSQAAVRVGGLGHAHANCALLPATCAALRERAPEELARLDAIAGVTIERLAERLRERAGAHGLGTIDDDEELIERTIAVATFRVELGRVAPTPSQHELRSILRRAAA